MMPVSVKPLQPLSSDVIMGNHIHDTCHMVHSSTKNTVQLASLRTGVRDQMQMQQIPFPQKSVNTWRKNDVQQVMPLVGISKGTEKFSTAWPRIIQEIYIKPENAQVHVSSILTLCFSLEDHPLSSTNSLQWLWNNATLNRTEWLFSVRQTMQIKISHKVK